MALDADIAAARTAYLENADYEEADSVTKAKAFITACVKLLAVPITRTANAGRDGNELEMNPELIATMRDDARRWLAAALQSTSNPAVIHADFTDFRS